MNYNKDLKKVMTLYPNAETSSSEDFKHLINIHNIAEATLGNKLEDRLVITAFNCRNDQKLETENDYYYLVFKTAMNTSGLKKLAYPMMFGQEELDEEFNIEKWSSLVHKIYDAVNSGDMNLQFAIDYYANTLNSKTSEDEKFKRWIKYFQDGEHMKYNKKSDELRKQAYQFSLSGPGTYGQTNSILPKELGSSDNYTNKTNEKQEYIEWRNKLYSAIRRIDKLLRHSDDFVDPETNRDLADLLHHFDLEVRSLKHKVTAADIAFKYAEKFKKAGFNQGYEEFMKYSQDMAPDNLETTIAPNAKEGLGNAKEGLGNAEEGLGNAEEGSDVDTPTEVHNDNENALVRALSGNSGAKEGEYEELAGDIDLDSTVNKLEEIAGRLSDRRTIRMLAEFDIMLDRIGIAAMFPELAEAQSKLIDGYSYALTRVTKMLGMLASGKSLVEISNAKKEDMTSKTIKEVNKTFESKEAPEVERGAPAIQKGLEEELKPAVEPEAIVAEQDVG